MGLRGKSLRGGGQPIFLGLTFLLLLFPLGCPSKPVRPDIAKNGLIKPPLVMPRDVNATPPEMTQAPPPPPVFLNIRQPAPPPIHRASSNAEPEPEPVKHEAPQISPQLSPDESARDQASAKKDIQTAQQNLDSANGKRLTVNQRDMADKIRGFLKQAQDAIAISDWSRAKSLAEKARLLSDELVKSLRP
jgi:outer membrane biosynthesis protein TonB